MISFDELKNKWNTLPEPVRLDLLAYATALIEENKKISADKQKELEERLEKFNTEENAVSWGHIYNKMLEELI